MPHHFVKQLVKNKAREGLKATAQAAETVVKTAPKPKATPKPKPQPKATTPKPPPKPKQVQAEPISPEQAKLDAFQEVWDINAKRARDGKSPKGPIAEARMSARNILVDNNLFPDKVGSFDHTPQRSISGDVQAGIKNDSFRLESRPEYKSAQTGLPVGEFNSKSRRPFTPHHVNGLQDTIPFFEGKTPEEAAKRRKDLAVGGVAVGNQKANYESLFDGKKSAKASSNNGGIMSSDHADVHTLTDAVRKKFGIESHKRMMGGKLQVDRKLDTFNGTLIKDMPEEQQLALQLQLAWLDEAAVDQIQRARFKEFKKKFGHLPQAEQREIILNNPELFANLSTNV